MTIGQNQVYFSFQVTVESVRKKDSINSHLCLRLHSPGPNTRFRKKQQLLLVFFLHTIAESINASVSSLLEPRQELQQRQQSPGGLRATFLLFTNACSGAKRARSRERKCAMRDGNGWHGEGSTRRFDPARCPL